MRSIRSSLSIHALVLTNSLVALTMLVCFPACVSIHFLIVQSLVCSVPFERLQHMRSIRSSLSCTPRHTNSLMSGAYHTGLLSACVALSIFDWPQSCMLSHLNVCSACGPAAPCRYTPSSLLTHSCWRLPYWAAFLRVWLYPFLVYNRVCFLSHFNVCSTWFVRSSMPMHALITARRRRCWWRAAVPHSLPPASVTPRRIGNHRRMQDSLYFPRVAAGGGCGTISHSPR
jgi:hypothetical protein